MRLRVSIHLLMWVLLPGYGLAHAASALAAEASGVLASIRGEVTVQKVGSGPSRNAELGMRLDAGDLVRVGERGAAAVYLSGGGGMVHVPAGQQFTVPRKSADSTKVSHALPLASPAMRVSEAGLWLLNDPQGSIFVAAMRGGDETSDDEGPSAATILSPRNETVVTGAPTFYATGGSRPTRIAVASGKKLVWRGGSFEGEGPWSIAELPRLQAGGLYLWRLESVKDGSPLSGWAPFRVAAAEDRQRTEAFEREIAPMSSPAEGNSVADLLRCGYYLKLQSWTPLLGAARRILEESPGSQVGRRARDQAVQGLHLDSERAALLERKFSRGGK